MDIKEENLAKTQELPSIEVGSDDETPAEEVGHDSDQIMEDEKSEAIQIAVALEVRKWLEEHGTKLFALEVSKKRVRQEKADLKQGIQRKPEERIIPMESALGERATKRTRIGPRI